jgi:hypothetical protein
VGSGVVQVFPLQINPRTHMLGQPRGVTHR